MTGVSDVARAMKGNLGPGQPGLDWWGKVTAVAAGPPPTVAVSLRGLTGSVITCKIGAAYLAQVPAVGDTVFGRQDQRGDYWCVDRIAAVSQSGNPRGAIAHAEATAGASGIGSSTTMITGVQASGLLVAGRWYRVRGSCLMQQGAAAGVQEVSIWNNTTNVEIARDYSSVGAGGFQTFRPSWEGKCVASPTLLAQIAPGVTNFTLQVLVNASTAAVLYAAPPNDLYNAEVTLEDFGANF